MEAGKNEKSDASEEDVSPTKEPSPTPLFLFYSCKTSGKCFMWAKTLDIAVHCWPYSSDAPVHVFFRKINHRDVGKTESQDGNHSTDGISNKPPHAVTVIKELLQWIDEAVKKASSALQTKLYPVLLTHGGEMFQFLFLFRMLENYNISATDTLEAHNVHFADPLPVLKQYKEARHEWLVDSRSLGLASLLNDWFPAQYNESDLLFSKSRGSLMMKLYTQSCLYWLLYRVPIYNIQEWIEFYGGEKLYQEDKQDLQEHLPESITSFQRKWSIRQLQKHGYNWSSLIDLYKVCGSPEHFRQELRDMDLKSSAANQVTFAINAMKLEQDGSREYKVRIKSNMPYAKYCHLTDSRGRHFILRVANVLPPCFFTASQIIDNQWTVPSNLLQIGPPETWDAMLRKSMINAQDKSRHNGEDNNQSQRGIQTVETNGCHLRGEDLDIMVRLMSVRSDTDEEDEDWEQDSGILPQDEDKLPESYFKEPAPEHVFTTLVTGVKVKNPFAGSETEWIASDPSQKKTDSEPLTTDDASAVSSSPDSTSSAQFPSSATVESRSLLKSPQHDHGVSSRSYYNSARTNQGNRAKVFRNGYSDNQNGYTSTNYKQSGKVPHRTNKSSSEFSHRQATANHSSPTWTKTTNQQHCFPARHGNRNSSTYGAPPTSPDSTSANNNKARLAHLDSSNQVAPLDSHHSPPANLNTSGSSTCSPMPSRERVRKGASPWEKGHIPPRFRGMRRNTEKKTWQD